MADSTPRGISYPTPDDKIKDGSSPSALADDFMGQANSTDAAITAGVQEAIDDATTKYGGLPARITAVETKNTAQDSRLDQIETKNTDQDANILAARWYQGVLPIGTNLNSFFEVGICSVDTTALSETITGKPGDSRFAGAFNVTVEKISETNGIFKQTIEAKTSGSTRVFAMVRTSLSNEFLGWERSNESSLEAAAAAAWGKGMLTTGQNLNSTITEGTSFANTAAVSASITNKPAWFDSNPFAVENITLSTASGITLQRAVQKVSGNPTTRKAERVSLSGTFLEWINPEAGSNTARDTGMVTILGDSQSERSATSWDQAVIAALNGTTVINHARSGDESNTVLMREGILELVCRVEGGSIPASGTVNLTTNMVVQVRENRLLIGGTLNGVGGTLSFVSGNTWTFTRSTTGTAVSVPSWTVFKSSWGVGGSAQTAAHALIAWFGGNDFNYSMSGQERTIADHIIGNYRRFIEYCHEHRYRPIIAGVTNRQAAGFGSEGFAQVQRVNRELRRMFPDIFLDVQAYYAERAIYDAGLTPTQADLDAMLVGEIPPQLFLADGVHLVPEAHAAIGQHWIAPWLAAKGYARTSQVLPALPTLTPADMAA